MSRIPARNEIAQRKFAERRFRRELNVESLAKKFRSGEIKQEDIPNHLRDEVTLWLITNRRSKKNG